MGNDEEPETASLGAALGANCAMIDHIRVRFDFSEIDDVTGDDDVGSASRQLWWNCDAIAAQLAKTFYTGPVEDGILPVRSGTLLKCGKERTDPDTQIDPEDYCVDENYFRGSLVFEVEPALRIKGSLPRFPIAGDGPPLDLPPQTPGSPPPESTLDRIPPNKAYVMSSWRARISIGVR